MNPRCLICHEIIVPAISWGTIFLPEQETLICPTCEGKLELITGERCRICSRPFDQLDEQFRHGELCNDCLRWEEDPEWSGFLDQNVSLYHYNDFLKDVIARFKFRGDYIPAKIFARKIRAELSKDDLLVPIPLSDERLYERGFNQAEALIREAGFAPVSILTRLHSEKQSKRTREERIHFPQVFQISAEINIEGKKVVLLDDIYTTGSTLRHAAKLIKGAGANRIQSITLAR